MRKEEIKQAKFIVKKGWIKKVNPVIKEGDIILVSLKDEPVKNQYVLISYCEKQWIEKYNKQYKQANIYPIISVEMNS